MIFILLLILLLFIIFILIFWIFFFAFLILCSYFKFKPRILTIRISGFFIRLINFISWKIIITSFWTWIFILFVWQIIFLLINQLNLINFDSSNIFKYFSLCIYIHYQINPIIILHIFYNNRKTIKYFYKIYPIT